MSKKLNMMYNWIGPSGPISNTRIPNAYDIVRNMFNRDLSVNQGLDPVYNEYSEYIPINLVTPQWLRKSTEPFVYELEMLHTRDWESNFNPGFGILDNTCINEEVFYRIRMKQGFFLITTPMESFIDDVMLSKIHKYFTINKFPLSQIIYLTNAINCKDIYESYCQRYNVTDRINCEYGGTWIRILSPDCRDLSLQTPYIAGPKNKTFLKFNRRYREQRSLFLMEIFNRGLLDDFHISFTKSEPENGLSFVEYAKHTRDMFGMNFTDDAINKLNDRLPLVLDTPDLSVFPVEKSLDQTKKFYDESLIHIIAETNFFSNIMHFTEKTLKPIMYKQPFIVVGPKDSLKHIKNLGFKTFDGIWEENYDTITDNMERMYRVLDLIESISKLTDAEKIDISNKVKDIVEYNFNHLKNRKPTELYEFVERYGV